MSVKAITPAVLPGHGLRFWTDEQFELARDEHLTATFDDLLGLPDAPPYRRVRGVKPPVSPESRARSARAVPTTPAASGSPTARGHLPSKETR